MNESVNFAQLLEDADLGNESAVAYLQDLLQFNSSLNQVNQSVVEILHDRALIEKESEPTNPWSRYLYACYLHYGNGCPQDIPRARELYQSIQNKIDFAVYQLALIARIENLPGSIDNLERISKTVIHDHEEAGETAIYLIAGVGIVALFGFYAEVKDKKMTSAISIGILIIAIVAFVLTARTSYLGGKIRHTEMSAPPVSQNLNGQFINDIPVNLSA